MVFRSLVVLCLVGYSLAQTDCIKDLQDCMKPSSPPTGGSGGSGRPNQPPNPPPNAVDMKKQIDGCFTGAGCDITCFAAVENKIKAAMSTCMPEKDQSVNFPIGGHGGEFGPRGFGGHGFGGHGAPGAQFGGPGGPGGFNLTKICKNSENVKKATDCMRALAPQQLPLPAARPGRNAGFAGGKDNRLCDCEAKFPTCKATFDQRRQTICNCIKKMNPIDIMKAEPSCASLIPENAGKTPPQHDCAVC